MELLITAAIASILAAIALPNLMRGRTSAQEAAAAASIQRIREAQNLYATLYPQQGYADRLWKLGGKGPVVGPEAAQLLDDSLASAESTPKGGYRFVLETESALPRSRYLVKALPVDSGGMSPRPLCSGIDGFMGEASICHLDLTLDEDKP